MSIPISVGSGTASVAAEAVAGLQYQQIEVLGSGGSSVLSIDSQGRAVIKPFATEALRIEGYASIVSSSITTLVAAPGGSLRNYITDIMIANTGAVTTAITFQDGLGSILGYTIAPAGGGSNMIGFATPMRTGVNASFDFQPVSASSILYATVKGYKA